MKHSNWIEIPQREYTLAHKSLKPLTTTFEDKDNIELSFPTGEPALKVTRLTKYPMFYRHKSVDVHR